MKGAIQTGHYPVNKGRLVVPSFPPIIFTEISEIEEELQKVDLPDRTRSSGGNTLPVEFTATHPMHHTLAELALEAWFKEGQDPVSPRYKKAGVLEYDSIDGTNPTRKYGLLGVFIFKRVLPATDMNNEGEMAQVVYSFSADDVLPGA